MQWESVWACTGPSTAVTGVWSLGVALAVQACPEQTAAVPCVLHRPWLLSLKTLKPVEVSEKHSIGGPRLGRVGWLLSVHHFRLSPKIHVTDCGHLILLSTSQMVRRPPSCRPFVSALGGLRYRTLSSRIVPGLRLNGGFLVGDLDPHPTRFRELSKQRSP